MKRIVRAELRRSMQSVAAQTSYTIIAGEIPGGPRARSLRGGPA
ncbi:MAG TPA: hypothetical protein VK025_05060 [Steroidobacter sp.]|nr:hypothetical protein [Steroidobacteraceae bacterium]HLS80751.1 hypothetical protein [Steroidobacter sp.]